MRMSSMICSSSSEQRRNVPSDLGLLVGSSLIASGVTALVLNVALLEDGPDLPGYCSRTVSHP